MNTTILLLLYFVPMIFVEVSCYIDAKSYYKDMYKRDRITLQEFVDYSEGGVFMGFIPGINIGMIMVGLTTLIWELIKNKKL